MNQRLLKPYMEEIREDNLVFSCWEEKKFGFSLWNKIFDGEICRKAFGKVKDGSFPKAQDLYAFFLIAYYSKTYRGIDVPLYRYKFGLGVTGSNNISVNKFDILLTERRIWECLTEFIKEQKEESRYQTILDGIYQHFLGECVNRWKSNLQLEIFRKDSGIWRISGDFKMYCVSLQRRTGIWLHPLLKKWFRLTISNTSQERIRSGKQSQCTIIP